MDVSRRASHSGSWYTDHTQELNKQLSDWLGAADLSHGPARAIISPHAGYSYCGACAAFAYRQISPIVVRKIFILGPSHHVRLAGCALTTASIYKTPLYNLKIDKQVIKDLMDTGYFEWMSMETDEDEHSIEMQLPYIAKVMEDYKDAFTVVPILVGSLTPDKEAMYGKLLAPYLEDPSTLFVISSDFCHWGQRFRYTYYDKSCGAIHKSIKNLDKMGMDLIENLTPSAFTDYLKKYGNTICGRHPISVLLQMIKSLKERDSNQRMNLKFLKYAQSSQCNNINDSSVSYASASLVIE
ncbi:protein MEMO1 [Trichogramma pretiosum]|uniref:protein MEMO1 n=1 Tax=Trichogramma pretiosum TaxID=7493 RepID=UPI0006C950CF|nr:protein MEMO1 [Trichogramma pretiosum]XP_014237174.1 protein MEMO1 [Trichogramma pretiosum]